jgi:Spy/CpxP family protein refolding chaperone
MNLKKIIMSAAILLTTAACWAQFQPAGKPQGHGQPGVPQMHQSQPQPPPFMEDCFPPELIMQNQQSLGLSDEQKKGIREIMKKSISEFTDLLWKEGSEQETMGSLLKQEKVDEAKAIAQLDKLLSIENGIKRLHMSTMIKVKNLLTPEQQSKLGTMKRPKPFDHGDRRGSPSRDKMDYSKDKKRQAESVSAPIE